MYYILMHLLTFGLLGQNQKIFKWKRAQNCANNSAGERQHSCVIKYYLPTIYQSSRGPGGAVERNSL